MMVASSRECRGGAERQVYSRCIFEEFSGLTVRLNVEHKGKRGLQDALR